MQKTFGNRRLRAFSCTVLLSLGFALAMMAASEPAGLEAQGVLMGIARISILPGPGQRGFTFQPVANAKIYLSDDAQLLAGGTEPGIVAISQEDGKFTFWDPSVGGGRRDVTAVWTPPGSSAITSHMTTTEVMARSSDADSRPAAETLRKSKNSGWVTLLFNPQASAPLSAPAMR